MLIKKIQIEKLHYSAKAQRYAAVIILTTDDSTICLQGRAHVRQDAPRSELVACLVSDAMRQLRRLPEYRGDTQEVAVCRRVTPEFRQSA